MQSLASRAMRWIAPLASAVALGCGGVVAGAAQQDGPDAGPAPTPTAASPCQTEAWSQRLHAPIIPLRRVADIDLGAGGPLTLPALGALTCEAVRADPTADKASASIPLDPDATIFVHYDTRTLRVSALTLTAGYAGAIDFGNASATYRVQIGAPITKNGAPLVLDWNDPGFGALVEDLYRALAATFATPVAAPSSGATCIETGACARGTVGDLGYVSFPAIGTTIWVATTTGAQPGPSTPSRIDQTAP